MTTLPHAMSRTSLGYQKHMSFSADAHLVARPRKCTTIVALPLLKGLEDGISSGWNPPRFTYRFGRTNERFRYTLCVPHHEQYVAVSPTPNHTSDFWPACATRTAMVYLNLAEIRPGVTFSVHIFLLLFFNECFRITSSQVRPSCDHGWIPEESVKVRQSTNRNRSIKTCVSCLSYIPCSSTIMHRKDRS